jgi:hypothetical protein
MRRLLAFAFLFAALPALPACRSSGRYTSSSYGGCHHGHYGYCSSCSYSSGGYYGHYGHARSGYGQGYAHGYQAGSREARRDAWNASHPAPAAPPPSPAPPAADPPKRRDEGGKWGVHDPAAGSGDGKKDTAPTQPRYGK